MKYTILWRKRLSDAGEFVREKVYRVGGTLYTPAEFRAEFAAELAAVKKVHHTIPSKPLCKRTKRAWPIHSEALAVNPEDRAAAEEDARKKGVPTSFDSEGRPILTGRAHRREFFRAYGWYDRDAGYGDTGKGSFKG